MRLSARLPYLFLLALLSSSAPVPKAQPAPLSASLAQGLIAALTFAHAGVIGYAISHQSQTQAELIGEQYLTLSSIIFHLICFYFSVKGIQSYNSYNNINVNHDM